ncbi:MAG: exodeoxyribonuclease VII small subunit [Anaerolineae bacterium]|nr:exodeoxyribonuclease VII small subunit [Anaerolineae bacterium]MDW8069948.1 exodeoxyribonuclease VII small subunit [Anaerolineae bacterium]
MSEVEHLTFEQALAELEQLVQEMESGNLELERALQLFERGMQLVRYCNQQLDAAELRVRQLAPDALPGEEPGLTSFEPPELSEEPW